AHDRGPGRLRASPTVTVVMARTLLTIERSTYKRPPSRKDSAAAGENLAVSRKEAAASS
ncbi:hypothetical protein Pmar_PMAR010830, partial [Perkinsus marinus ATCC 50983]